MYNVIVYTLIDHLYHLNGIVNNFLLNIHILGVAATISTLPVVTKCQFIKDKIEMTVVILDKQGIISEDFTSGNDILDIFFDVDQSGNYNYTAVNESYGRCGIDKDNYGLEYFKVRDCSTIVQFYHLRNLYTD